MLIVKGQNSSLSCLVIVTMEHTAKGGKHKILPECNLPLTGKKCVDMVITELGVFEFPESGIMLTEIAEGVAVEDVVKATGCKFDVSPDLKTMASS